tara:strand:+ start:299 stop:568 length:270 start_codon:yes stop_codon:yes gene_type:complete
VKRVEITIINKLGLHARAAAKLVALASEFESEVWLVREGKRVDATSIMAVMMLAAGQGTALTVEAEGPDESRAVESIAALVDDRFGEGE